MNESEREEWTRENQRNTEELLALRDEAMLLIAAGGQDITPQIQTLNETIARLDDQISLFKRTNDFERISFAQVHIIAAMVIKNQLYELLHHDQVKTTQIWRNWYIESLKSDQGKSGHNGNS